MPHEADVHAETAVYGGAIDAEKDPIRDGRPGSVLRIAIETHKKKKQQKHQRTLPPILKQHLVLNVAQLKD